MAVAIDRCRKGHNYPPIFIKFVAKCLFLKNQSSEMKVIFVGFSL